MDSGVTVRVRGAALALAASPRLWTAGLVCTLLLTAYTVLVPAPLGALALLLLVPVGGYDVCILRRVALGQEPLPSLAEMGTIPRRGASGALIGCTFMSSLLLVTFGLVLGIFPLMFVVALVSRAWLPALESILGPVLLVLLVAWTGLVWSFLILGPFPRFALGDRLRAGFTMRGTWTTFLRHRRAAMPVLICEFVGLAFVVLVQQSLWWPLRLGQAKARWALVAHPTQATIGLALAVMAIAVVGAAMSVALRFVVAYLAGQYAGLAFGPEVGLGEVEPAHRADAVG